jgi:hypothetical protein
MTSVPKNTNYWPPPRPGGMSYAELFGPEKQPEPASPAPEAAGWRQAFKDHVANVLRARALPQVEAEKIAFHNTLVEFLNSNFPDTDPIRCAHCGSSERPNDLRPMGGGTCHRDCWEEWRERRRADATVVLAAMEIVPP